MSLNTNTPIKEFLQTLYEALMREVEPELTPDVFDDVELSYLDETPEEHEERMKHYAEALQIVHERFETTVKQWSDELTDAKKKFLQEKHLKQSQEDASQTEFLESQFNLQ